MKKSLIVAAVIAFGLSSAHAILPLKGAHKQMDEIMKSLTQASELSKDNPKDILKEMLAFHEACSDTARNLQPPETCKKRQRHYLERALRLAQASATIVPQLQKAITDLELIKVPGE